MDTALANGWSREPGSVEYFGVAYKFTSFYIIFVGFREPLFTFYRVWPIDCNHVEFFLDSLPFVCRRFFKLSMLLSLKPCWKPSAASPAVASRRDAPIGGGAYRGPLFAAIGSLDYAVQFWRAAPHGSQQSVCWTGELESYYETVFEKIGLTEICLDMFEKGPKSKFTVSVEGNIGSGKSTLLQHFAKFNDVEVLQEPVDKWRNVRGYNLLVSACSFLSFVVQDAPCLIKLHKLMPLMLVPSYLPCTCIVTSVIFIRAWMTAIAENEQNSTNWCFWDFFLKK